MKLSEDSVACIHDAESRIHSKDKSLFYVLYILEIAETTTSTPVVANIGAKMCVPLLCSIRIYAFMYMHHIIDYASPVEQSWSSTLYLHASLSKSLQ